MTELEKLKNTAKTIQNLTEGRIQIRSSEFGHCCIHVDDNAYINLNMIFKSDLEQRCYDISFSGYVRRMGGTMNTGDLGVLSREVHQMQALLTALEMTRLRPKLNDLQAFHDYLLQQEQVQVMNAQSM